MKIKGLTLQDVLLENIKSEKEAGITFIEGENNIEYLSYKKLYLEASYKLYALQQQGLNPGDELVFQFQSNKNLIITFWACVLGRLIPVPIALGTTSDIINKICRVWEKLKNPYIITDVPSLKMILEEFGSKDEGVLKEILSKFIYYTELTYIQKASPISVSPSDLVFIQYSSGSTGLPKGVMNSQESILYNTYNTIEKLNIQNSDRFLGWMPLTHDMGLIFFHILPLLVNASQFLMPPILFLSHPEIWLESLSEKQITISGSPNFGYAHVLENLKNTELERLSFNKLRMMINSAEPVSIQTCRKFTEALTPYGLVKNCINPGYGLAEAVLGVSICLEEEKELKEHFLNRNKLSLGDKVEFVESNSDNVASFADLGIYDGTEIKITNENDEILLEDTLGVIQLKSLAITSGYYNDSEATKNVLSKDGWFNTGDIGFIHNERLIITGREKEMIIISGQNYFPNDLDNLIEKLPEIKFQQAISCNVFNEKKHQDELFVFVHYTRTIKDFIVLADSIKRFISEQIGITIKKVIAVKKIPRTSSGKIQRYILRNNYFNGDYDEFLEKLKIEVDKIRLGAMELSKEEIERKIISIVKNFLSIEYLSNTSNFFDLGFTSLQVIQLKGTIESFIYRDLDDVAIFKYTNAKDLSEHIYTDIFGHKHKLISSDSKHKDNSFAKERMRRLIKPS